MYSSNIILNEKQIIQGGMAGGYTAMKPSVQFVKIEEDPEINIVVTDIIDMSTIW